jgi:hypothetical protein
MVWPGKGEACCKVGVTANLTDVSDAKVGTKKRVFEIEPRNRRRKASPPWPTPLQRKGPGADSEEKHEPVSDIDTALMDSPKVLDPKWPIREADL